MNNLFAGLNENQKKAVANTSGPMMIIAGAGSGKTKVITLRIANLLQQGVTESQILALTFSNKAAKEMKERISPYCKDKPPIISTFHSFGYYLISRFSGKLKLPKKFTIYDTNDQIQIVKDLLKLKNYPMLFANKKNEVNAYTQQQHISLLKNNLLPDVHQNKDITQLRTDYDNTLQAYHALDFDDLLIKPIELLNNHPEVLETLHKQFKYFLVDEFQDTSTLQFNTIRALASASNNICVVGDDDQSIYSWRGADLKNWTRFANAFPTYSEVILDTSYRCSANILKAANSVIATGPRLREKNLKPKVDNNLEVPIHIMALPDENAEAEYISDMASYYHYKHQIAWNDIGILTRTNNLFNPIELALGQLHIPYEVSGGSSFFDNLEIKDLISYLRLCVNYKDDISCRRIINTPKRGLGASAINALSNYAQQHKMSLFEACVASYNDASIDLASAAKNNCYDFTQLIQEQTKKLEVGSDKNQYLSNSLREIISHTEYEFYLRQNYIEHPKIFDWKQKNLEQLIEIIERYESQQLSNIDILNALSYLIQNNADKIEDKLSLMTIHASKGLEKQVIFIAGMEYGIMPHSRSIEENPEQIHEETRLCYVAITRAKQYLHLSWCKTRNNKRTQQVQQQIPSPYLKQIPDDIISRELPKENPEEALVALENFSVMLDSAKKNANSIK